MGTPTVHSWATVGIVGRSPAWRNECREPRGATAWWAYAWCQGARVREHSVAAGI